MNRLVTLGAIASISLVTATLAFAQGRFGKEAQQRAADRLERDAIRRAEHPELYQAAASKPSEPPGQDGASVTQPRPTAEPSTEPAPSAAPAQ